MADLETLIHKRGQIKARLTRLKTAYQNFLDDHDINTLEFVLNKTLPIWDQYSEISNEIELLDRKNVESHREKLELFENDFAKTVTQIAREINEKKASESNTVSETSLSNNTQNNFGVQVKLPVLNLNTFDGQYNQWVTFCDTFTSLIHCNEKLDNTQKFHYLKSCLRGEASNVISSLAMTSENYTNALTILKSRYENKRLIIKTHMDSIFNLPQVVKDSASSLRKFLDTITTHLNALKSLGLPTDSWDAILIHLITSKLDITAKKEWESTKFAAELPTFSEIHTFLTNRSLVLETISNDQPSYKKQFIPFSQMNNRKPVVAANCLTASSVLKCKICNEPHDIYQCPQFKSLSPENRYKEIIQLKLCINCLGNHHIGKCQSHSSCRRCNKKHHTFLHREYANPSLVESSSSQIRPNLSESNHESSSNVIVNHCYKILNPIETLLSTAIILIEDHNGHFQRCRCLLDVGSQSHFLSESLCNKLQLKTNNVKIPIMGINQVESSVNKSATVRIKSCCENYSADLNCLVIKQITGNVPLQNVSKLVKIPKDINLADPTFYSPSYIDLLIGVQLFWDLLLFGKIKLSNDQPFWQKTKLGWVVGGTIQDTFPLPSPRTQCNLSLSSLEQSIKKFWEIEESNVRMLSHDEHACESHFIQTHSKTAKGRFVVRLPFKDIKGQLGESRKQAISRFYSLERKLTKNPPLQLAYREFMDEYIKLGHMHVVNDSILSQSTASQFYLPHHAVINNNSSTTKVRVVFDGSAKTTSHINLNDVLMVGPTIQQELFSVLLRLRTHLIAFTADIKKMYRQVLVHKDDRKYQRIVWRHHPLQPLKTYELATVTYGTTSAPFLAIRSLQQIGLEYQLRYPQASKAILNDFYVDDLLTGANTVDEALQLRNEIQLILSTAQFELGKFASNDRKLLDGTCNSETKSTEVAKNTESRTLGLTWNFHSDTFKYKVFQFPSQHKITKRTLLAQISQIYDPLGLIGPLTTTAKILMQSLWTLKLDWDDSIPSALQTKWFDFVKVLHVLHKLEIPRKIITPQRSQQIELHGFSDASEACYGACLYLRVINHDDTVSVNLLCSKSRVAPLKKLSIPRLELCAAVLLAELAHKVIPILNINITNHYFWTDSMIVLAWLATDSGRWKTFVANRVSQIQEVTKFHEWRHIATKDNPADLISRGVSSLEPISSNLWLHGPPFLSYKSSFWPKISCLDDINEIPEQKSNKLTTLVTSNANHSSLFSQYSSFSKLQRIVAYIRRFKNNCLKLTPCVLPHLTSKELEAAKYCIVQVVQSQVFKFEIEHLKQGRELPPNSKIRALSPFLDNGNILRLGGRLRNANLSYDRKFPIILPHKHHVTELLVRQEHVLLLHSGPQVTLANLRLKYWPISGRNIVRKIISKCVTCFKNNPKMHEQKMGDLPKERIEPTRPFLNTGIDYAGPITIKEGRQRGKKHELKVYLVLFICLATKAVHLDLVLNLTSESFLNTLKRFIARRGMVSNLYSDNGTTFFGANRELRNLYNLLKSQSFTTTVTQNLSINNISWHFIPPRAPHFGGLWEAGIKRVKFHLHRIIGNTLLTYEELYTLLTQVEACINSRPLFPLSNDPNDLSVLTPAHFLIGDSLVTPVEENFTQTATNRLKRWEHICKMTQHFWKRWSSEYLTELNRRSKWQSSTTEISPGTMVLLRDDQLPPNRWALGRILEVFKGNDNLVRVITVKTNRGVYKRPVTKVCPLPIGDNMR